MYIQSVRQRRACEYALEKIKNSKIADYVTAIYLFGSCARGDERWESDVDLFIQVDDTIAVLPRFKRELRILKGSLSMDGVYDPEIDAKFMVGDEWKRNRSLFYKNVLREGINIWD